MTASIGIVPGCMTYESAENMLRDADTAMYRAKDNGKARYEIFDRKMHEQVTHLVELEADLRRAVERDELFLVYQPIVSLKTQAINGFEALVRWQHPEHGTIPPNDFIPLAEETGLILPMSLWILREACRQMREWQTVAPLAETVSVSIKISSRHFLQPDLVEQVAEILRETGLAAKHLKLEITESAVMDSTERTAEKLRELRALGVKLSLDDFGTGYSSLSYLHRFPLDELKIDRSFGIQIETAGEHAEIVRTIISLAGSLGMETVAEGVETESQLECLRSFGCEYAKGFYFSKPIAPDAARQMLVEDSILIAAFA